MSSDAYYIEKAFGHKLVGNRIMKKIVPKTLSILPEETVLFVTKNCWFVSSLTDSWAFTLKYDDLKKGEYLIFLSDELLQQDKHQITWTIIHEIGHIILGHKNSIGTVQSKTEIKRQEKEADKFVRRYLSIQG